MSPTAAEQSSISNLVTKVQTCLDNLVVAPGDFNTCQLDEVRQVGSFKKGTTMAGNNVAEIVVILKTLPTKEACDALGNKVEADLKNLMKTEVVTKLDTITKTLHERGFDISNSQARVCVFIATLPQNIRKLESGTHLESKAIQNHLAEIRHSRWFEENAHHSSIKVLIRLLRDITTRFDGFAGLTPWMIDLLGHLVIMKNPSRQALPISLAFRRVFQLLAAGLFLPGSAGINDPCENGHIRVHTSLTLEQQDMVCLTAQTLLRVLNHGGWKHVLGLEGSPSIAQEMTVWNGVAVSPLEVVFDRPITESSLLEMDGSGDLQTDDGDEPMEEVAGNA